MMTVPICTLMAQPFPQINFQRKIEILIISAINAKFIIKNKLFLIIIQLFIQININTNDWQ